MKKLHLNDWHKSNNAVLSELNGWQIPDNYGDVSSEVHAAINSSALLDRSYLGKVLLRGNDTLEFLDKVSTNDMTKLLASTVCDTLFSTPRGNLVDYCRVLNLDDETLMISSFMGNQHILDWVNRFIYMTDIEPQDAGDSFIWLTLMGPSCAELVYSVCNEQVCREDDAIWLHYSGQEFPALRNDNFMVPAYNVCLPAEGSEEIVSWLAEKVLGAGGSLMGDAAFQILRVESGMPDWGTEITEEYNAHEARLLNAVSFTKEEFTGQEALAAIDTFDKIQRYLMIIDVHGVVSRKPPFNVYYDGEPIGKMTSYAFDPLNGRHVGLGYIKRLYAVHDINLMVEVQEGSRRVPASLRIPPIK